MGRWLAVSDWLHHDVHAELGHADRRLDGDAPLNATNGDYCSCREDQMATCTEPIRYAVTSRSYHPNSVNVLFMDGSGHTIADGIDLATCAQAADRTDKT